MTEPWLPRSPSAGARLRLFCFPYSGASASLYYAWQSGLPGGIEVCPVELPGRGRRFGEEPYTALAPLVAAAGDGLRPHLDRPYAFFGHSMGALVAFELTRLLRREGGPLPLRLFVSGHVAPQHNERDDPLHRLADQEFLERVQALNGTPPEVLANEEFRDLILPILRADFTLCETYRCRDEPPLPCGVSAYGGLGDAHVSRERLDAWRVHTDREFVLRLFPGDHFFLNTARATLLEALARELQGGSGS